MRTKKTKTPGKRLSAIFLAVAIAFGGVPLALAGMSQGAYAAGGGDPTKAAPAGFETQDIATITIDHTKIRGVQPTVSSTGGGGANVTYAWSQGYLEASSDAFKEGGTDGNAFPGGGNYTLTYADAVVYPDGTRGNLEVTFSDIKFAFRTKDDNGNALPSTTFSDRIRVFNSNHFSQNPAVSCYSLDTNNRVGLRETVTVTATGSGNASNTTNTFIYTGYGFNVARTGEAFTYLAYAAKNNNWSEGLTLPGNVAIGDNLEATTYSDVDAYKGASGATDTAYDSGFAGTVSNGASHRVYASAGQNHGGMNSYILTDGITHTTTSSSGDNGKIEVWSSGTIDQGTQLRDDPKAVRTYDVPDKKVVEYKMTPDDGFIINQIWVNKNGASAGPGGAGGTKVLPTEAVLDANGKPSYYIYRFEATDIDDQAIHVEWQKARTIKVEKTWLEDDDWKDETRPDSLTLTLYADGKLYKGQSPDRDKVAEDGTAYNPTRVMNDNGTNTWTYKFENLPRHDKDGLPIKYTVKETKLDEETAPYTYTPDYDSEIEFTPGLNEATYKIENTLKTAPLKVTKAVVNDDNPSVPTFDFTATLTGAKNPSNTYTGTVTGVKDGETKTFEFSVGSSQTATEVPVGIQYNVVEDDSKGYNVTYASQSAMIVVEGGSTATVTNTAPNAEVIVTKKWDDNDDQDGLRPDDADAVKAMFTLYKQVGTGSATAVTNPAPTVVAGSDGSYTVTWTGLKKLEGGQEITYTVKETTPPDEYEPVGGEDVALSKTTDATTKNDTYTGELTNKHEPYTTKLQVEKTWNDTESDFFTAAGDPVPNYQRPGVPVKVKGVYDDGGTEKVAYPETTITITGDTKKSVTTWLSEELKDLPVFWDGGKPIKYVVSEEDTIPPGYSGTKTTDEVTPKLNAAGDAYECDNAKLANTPVTRKTADPIELVIKKVDAESGTGLADGVFTVTAGSDEQDYTTGADGTVSVPLNSGTYKVVEKTAPQGYTADATEYEIVVEEGDIELISGNHGYWEMKYELVYSDATKAKLESDGKTLIVKDTPITEEATVSRTITYKYVNEDGNEAVAAKTQQVKLTRKPKIDSATGKMDGWTDWTAAEGFPAVQSPTYAGDDATKSIKGWSPEEDAPEMAADDIAATANDNLPADYDTMTDAQKQAFWADLSQSKFAKEVYYKKDAAPAGNGATKDDHYDMNGNVKSQTWTPDDALKERITGYAVLPDGQGTPNSIMGYALLDDNGNEVLTLTVPGEGTYAIDPDTGKVVFTPEKGFFGTGKGVTIRVKDMLGAEYGYDYPTVHYVPTVSENTPGSGTKTGDDSTGLLGLMALSLLVSGALLTTLGVKKRAQGR